MKRFVLVLLDLFLVAILGGCTLSDKTGTLSINISDAPVTNASQVYISFAGITLKGSEGEIYIPVKDNGENIQLSLMELTGSLSANLISNFELRAGKYQWIRLELATNEDLDTYVELDSGATHELTLPSGTELKLDHEIVIPGNGNASFTLDIDLQKSLVNANGTYTLKPVIRIVNDIKAGHIKGVVDADLLSENACLNALVYLMSGFDSPGFDINPTQSPDAVVPVDQNNHFEIGFITEGNYSLALSCNSIDDPEENDILNFIRTENAVVEAGKITVANI